MFVLGVDLGVSALPILGSKHVSPPRQGECSDSALYACSSGDDLLW